jgi:hypothetical protein
VTEFFLEYTKEREKAHYQTQLNKFVPLDERDSISKEYVMQ